MLGNPSLPVHPFDTPERLSIPTPRAWGYPTFIESIVLNQKDSCIKPLGTDDVERTRFQLEKFANIKFLWTSSLDRTFVCSSLRSRCRASNSQSGSAIGVPVSKCSPGEAALLKYSCSQRCGLCRDIAIWHQQLHPIHFDCGKGAPASMCCPDGRSP